MAPNRTVAPPRYTGRTSLLPGSRPETNSRHIRVVGPECGKFHGVIRHGYSKRPR